MNYKYDFVNKYLTIATKPLQIIGQKQKTCIKPIHIFNIFVKNFFWILSGAINILALQ